LPLLRQRQKRLKAVPCFGFFDQEDSSALEPPVKILWHGF